MERDKRIEEVAKAIQKITDKSCCVTCKNCTMELAKQLDTLYTERFERAVGEGNEWEVGKIIRDEIRQRWSEAKEAGK